MIFKDKDTQNVFACIFCATFRTVGGRWWPLGHTSYENHVIIIELNTSPNALLGSSALDAMFGVASTKEIGTRKLKNMNN